MAVGGGDVNSVPALCLTLVLLWSLLQWTAPWWLPGLAKRYPESPDQMRWFDRALTLVPALLLIIAALDLSRAHLAYDLTYAHVAAYGDAALPSWKRLLVTPFYSEGSLWFSAAVVFSVAQVVMEGRNGRDSLFDVDGDGAGSRQQTLRWNGWLWPIILLGFISSDVFAVHSEPQTVTGEAVGYSAVLFTCAGAVLLAVWVNALGRFSQSTLTGEGGQRSVLVSGGIASALLLTAALPERTAGMDWAAGAEHIALGIPELLLVTSLVVAFIGYPLFLSLLARVHAARGQASGRRFLGLARTFGHTLVFCWLSGTFLLEPLPSVNGWHSAMWEAFTLLLPLALFGLLGTLLPLTGLDARQRPEAWGFNLGMALSLPFLTMHEPLTALLAPGMFAAMTTTPLLATHPEGRVDLPRQTRAIESVVIITTSVAALIALHMGLESSKWLLAGILLLTSQALFAHMACRPTPEASAVGEQE